jgi:hypothetical protein
VEARDKSPGTAAGVPSLVRRLACPRAPRAPSPPPSRASHAPWRTCEAGRSSPSRPGRPSAGPPPAGAGTAGHCAVTARRAPAGRRRHGAWRAGGSPIPLGRGPAPRLFTWRSPGDPAESARHRATRAAAGQYGPGVLPDCARRAWIEHRKVHQVDGDNIQTPRLKGAEEERDHIPARASTLSSGTCRATPTRS